MIWPYMIEDFIWIMIECKTYTGKGEVYENQEQLEEFLQDSENTKLTEKYDTFIKKYMSGCDGHSCERLAGLINSYVGRK